MKKQLFLIIVIIGLMSCGNSSWEQTQETGTIEAYQTFIEENPEHENIAIAKRLLDSLVIVKDNDDWKFALKANTIKSVQEYIENYPAGINIETAKKEHKKLREMFSSDSLWQITIKEDTYVAYQKYVNYFNNITENNNTADLRLTELAQEKFKNELQTIVNFYSENYIGDYIDYFSKKQCNMILDQPTAEGGRDVVLTFPYDEQELFDDYGHWELVNQFPEMNKILTTFIEDGELSDQCEFNLGEDAIVLNFFFCPGGYCYYMNFIWKKEDGEFVITETSISLPSYM